jgi:hypothetical protein
MIDGQTMIIVPVAVAVVLVIVWLIVRWLTSSRRAMLAASKMVLDNEHMTDAERMLVLLEGINRRLLPVTVISVFSLVFTILGLVLIVVLTLTGNLELGSVLDTFLSA